MVFVAQSKMNFDRMRPIIYNFLDKNDGGKERGREGDGRSAKGNGEKSELALSH